MQNKVNLWILERGFRDFFTSGTIINFAFAEGICKKCYVLEVNLTYKLQYVNLNKMIWFLKLC